MIILRNQVETVTANSGTAWLIGVDDPNFTENGNRIFDLSAGIIAAEIKIPALETGIRFFCRTATYVNEGINLAFCSHTHGGQFHLPFIGGLVAANQGLFPEYDGDVYHENNITMVVSRGIGNSIISIRFNNRPEVVIAVLHK